MGEVFPGCAAPSFADQLGQSQGGRAVDDGLHIMEWIVWLAARVDAVLVTQRDGARYPIAGW